MFKKKEFAGCFHTNDETIWSRYLANRRIIIYAKFHEKKLTPESLDMIVAPSHIDLETSESSEFCISDVELSSQIDSCDSDDSEWHLDN